MSKTGSKPEKKGELNDFGGRDGEDGGTKHKGPHMQGNMPKRGTGWHGAKKSG